MMRWWFLAVLAGLVGSSGCGASESGEGEGLEPEGPIGEVREGLTVAEAAGNNGCLTTIVKGLSLLIIAEGNCLAPGAFVEVSVKPNLAFGPAVFPYMEQPAVDALISAVNAHPNMNLTMNSMLRTVAQQYLLYAWFKNSLCGITLANAPGTSPHETGLAFDTSDYSAWKSALQSKGFKWHGAGDVVHFDYVGAGAVNYKGTDVLAFQRLWNRNHPGDLIAEDGSYGPQTESRLVKSPASGFPKGAQCDMVPDAGGGGAGGGASSSSTGAGGAVGAGGGLGVGGAGGGLGAVGAGGGFGAVGAGGASAGGGESAVADTSTKFEEGGCACEAGSGPFTGRGWSLPAALMALAVRRRRARRDAPSSARH